MDHLVSRDAREHPDARSFNQVFFIATLKCGRSRSNPGEDSLLPTSLLRRIFISYNNRFIILSPKG
jgi:hypothetical protein